MSPAAPVAPTRIVGLDVARGLAVVGMFAAHLAPGGAERPWDGRSSVLFAVLAGVSLGLMTGGSRPGGPWFPKLGSIALRGLYLVVLGLLLTGLGTPIAIILSHYGVLFLLAMPLLVLPRPLVAAAVLLCAALGPVAVDAIATAGRAVMREAVPAQAELLAQPLLWFTRYYPVPAWLAYIALGVLIARCDVRSARTQRALMLGGLLSAWIGYGGGRLLGGPDEVEAHASTTAELLGAGGVAAVLIGALCALGERAARVPGPLLAALSPAAAVGAMPLTVYTGQILALAVYLRPYDPFDFEAWRSWPLLAAFLLTSVAFAMLWRRFLGQGPLEWLMARATLRPASGRALGRVAG